MDAVEVQGAAQRGDPSAVLPDTSCTGGEKAPVATVSSECRELPRAVRVVASMVNRVLKVGTG